MKGFQEIEEAYNSDLGVNRIYKLVEDLSYCRDYEELGYSLNQMKRNICELEDLKGELRRALENVINEVAPNIKINDELINEIACEIEEDIDKSIQEYETAMDVAANEEKGLSDDKNDIENDFLEQNNESSIDKKITSKYSYNNIMNQLAFSDSIELTVDDGVKVTLIKTDKGIIKKTVLENMDVPEIPGGIQKEESLKKIIDKANEFEARDIKTQELNVEVKDKDKVKEKSNEEMFL